MPITFGGINFMLLAKGIPREKDHSRLGRALNPAVFALIEEGPKTHREIVAILTAKTGKHQARTISNSLRALKERGLITSTRRKGVRGRSFLYCAAKLKLE